MSKDITGSLAWAGGLIAIALVATFARREGWIDADAVNRIVFGAIGLMVAWYGNRLPKTLAPSDVARRVNRTAGWSMAISGLAYALLWIFAPFDLALVGGCAVIIAGMLVTIATCLRARRNHAAI